MNPTDEIKRIANEVIEARAGTKRGDWKSLREIIYRATDAPSDYTSTMKDVEQFYKDEKFIILAANHSAQLAKALLIAVEYIKKLGGCLCNHVDGKCRTCTTLELIAQEMEK